MNSFAKELRITGTENDMFVDPGTNIISNKIKSGISLLIGSRTTVTNHEIKDFIKVIKSLENREILLKETTSRKIASQ